MVQLRGDHGGGGGQQQGRGEGGAGGGAAPQRGVVQLVVGGAGGGLQRAVAGGRGAAARILTHNILSCDVTKLRTVTTFYDEPHAATLPVVKLIFRLAVSA